MIEDMVPSGRSESAARAALAEKTDALRAFWDACDRHDWHYDRTDDHAVWLRGSEAARRLEIDAGTIDGAAELYARFRIWSTGSGAKPERP